MNSMSSLKDSLKLGGQGLLAWLDPNHAHLPVGGYEVAHDVGRWWDAMLRWEAATGLTIPGHIETAMLANLRRLTDNPDALLVTEDHWPMPNSRRAINPHNLRETMIAYHALVRYRRNDWARQAGHRFLQTLDRCFREDGHFDATRLALWGTAPFTDDPFIAEKEIVPGWFDGTTSTGRCLEAVVWFFEATGDELALRVADRFARHHLRMMVDDDGQPRAEFFRPDNVGHNHSYLGTVRGLLLFGLLTGQRAYLEAATNIYRRSIWRHNITASCYTTHDLGCARFKDGHGDKACESASAGDVAQIALWLATYDHQADLLADVERIVRAHLLRCQITEADLGPTRPDGRTITSKWIGGWGVLGGRDVKVWKDSTHDVHAAVVHSMADIYQHTVRRDACGWRLNWHFDYEDERARVVSRYEEQATLRVELKQPETLWLRRPSWAATESCRLKLDDGAHTVCPVGAYLVIPNVQRAELSYELPRRVTEERSVDGSTLRFEWLGDAIRNMERHLTKVGSCTRRAARLGLAAAALSLGLSASAAEPSGAIIRTPEKIHSTRDDIGGTVGNLLAILEPRTIDRLGVFDAGGDGLATPHEVGIWDIYTGKRVVSATVPAGTEGELIEGFRYVKLPAPVELKGGTPYRIGAVFTRGGDPFPDSAGYEGVFLGGDGVRLDDSVYTPGETLAPPTSGAPGGDPGIWTRAARWAAANALSTPAVPASAKSAPIQAPPLTPRIELFAEFTERTRYALFEPGERVSLWIRVTGRRLGPDNLLWSVTDWKGDLVGRGSIPVPMPAEAELPGFYSMTYKDQYRDWQASRPLREIPSWETVLKLPDYGAGYFAVHLKLEKVGVTLPRMGTRPEGMVTYAVQPAIERLPLAHVDDSRFGAQGYSFVGSGEIQRGDMVAPLYPAMGLGWVYGYRRPSDIQLDKYNPTPEESAKLWNDESKDGLCLLLTCTGLPEHMQAAPEGARGFGGDAYPPKDFDGYGNIIGKIAKERAQVRQAGLFPKQQHNYYEIHWEPDWHWKGTDEEFIRMYEVAWKAIHDNDPDGMLLGAKYGVLPRGVKNLERLLPMGLAKHLDGISTHSYCAWPDRSLRKEIRRLVELTRQYLKPGAPIIQAEVGSRDSVDWPGHPNPYRAQAALDLRAHLTILGEGVDTSFFFFLVDHGIDGAYGLFYNLTDPFPPFGATHVSPKPVGAAFAAATRLLEGTKTLRPLDFLGDDILCYTFQRGDQILAALWAADADGSCGEPRRAVRVPTGAERVTLFDPMGNARQIQCENGYATIQVGAEPVYLLGLVSAAVPTATAALASGQVLPPDLVQHPDAQYVLFQASREIPVKMADGKAWLPLDIGGGEWLLTARQSATGSWLTGTAISVQPPFTLEPGPVSDAQAKKRLFTVANTSDQVLSGRFEIRVVKPKHWSSATEPLLIPEPGVDALSAKDLELGAGKSQTIEIDPDTLKAPSSKGAELLAQFIDASGRVRRVKAGAIAGATERCHATPVARPPTIDGDLRDWKLELFQTVNTRDNVRSNPAKWQGEADLSFRWAIQYDQQALYLAVKVRDQSHVQEVGHWRSTWQEDSLQFIVGVHPFTGGAGGDKSAPGLNAAATPAKLGYAFFHEFCLALKGELGKERPIAWRFEGPEPFPRGELAPGNVTFMVRRESDETNYEIAIPWKELDPKLTGAPAEKAVGFGIVVNDMDIEKGFKAERKNMNPIGAFSSSPELGVMVLE